MLIQSNQNQIKRKRIVEQIIIVLTRWSLCSLFIFDDEQRPDDGAQEKGIHKDMIVAANEVI